MNDVDKAYNVGYIAALVMAKAHHMKREGKWDYLDPKLLKRYVSEESLKEIEASKDTPYCNICGEPALFQQIEDGTYSYCLSNYCPKCGSIMNPDIANKSPEDSIKEQVSEIQDVYNRMYGDLEAALGSDEVD